MAVDVTSGIGGLGAGGGRRPGGLARHLRRALTGSEQPAPHLGATIVRAVTAGRTDNVGAASLHADLVIRPSVQAIGPTDWKRLPAAVELGRRAARAALEAQPELAARLAGSAPMGPAADSALEFAAGASAR